MRSSQELEKIVDQLNYSWEKFDVDDFIHYVGTEVRKRRLVHFPIENLPLPWCVSGPQTDFIFYSANIGTVLKTHHKLHEVGHFVLGHVQSIEIIDSENVIEVIGRFYGHFRSTTPSQDPYKMQEENEAEYFAYLLQKKIKEHNRFYVLTSITSRNDIFLPPFSGSFAKRGAKK